LRPEQLATILHSMNPSMLNALSQATSNRTQQQQREQQEKEQKLREQQEKDRKLRMEQDAQRKAAQEAAVEAGKIGQHRRLGFGKNIFKVSCQIRNKSCSQSFALCSGHHVEIDIYSPNFGTVGFCFKKITGLK
jgi:hypothetical protein